MIKKQTTIQIAIVFAVVSLFFTYVYGKASPQYQYDYWYDGEYTSYPIYNFYTTGKYNVDENTVADCILYGCVFYTPASGEIPAPDEKWDGKPKVSGDLVFVHVPDIPGIKTASRTCFQVGDKIAFEVQSDALGSYSAIILSKQNGKWVEVSSDTVFGDSSSDAVSAIAEYMIQDSDKELVAVAKLSVFDAASGKIDNDGVVFLIDVGHSGIHLSVITLSCLAVICIISIVAFMISSGKKRDQKLV